MPVPIRQRPRNLWSHRERLSQSYGVMAPPPRGFAVPIEDEFRQAFREAVQSEIDAKLMPVVGMVAGVESALIAIVSALAGRGVLLAEEAKTAIDGVLAALTPENQSSGQGHVLRQLSEGLARMTMTGAQPVTH